MRTYRIMLDGAARSIRASPSLPRRDTTRQAGYRLLFIRRDTERRRLLSLYHLLGKIREKMLLAFYVMRAILVFRFRRRHFSAAYFQPASRRGFNAALSNYALHGFDSWTAAATT